MPSNRLPELILTTCFYPAILRTICPKVELVAALPTLSSFGVFPSVPYLNRFTISAACCASYANTSWSSGICPVSTNSAAYLNLRIFAFSSLTALADTGHFLGSVLCSLVLGLLPTAHLQGLPRLEPLAHVQHGWLGVTSFDDPLVASRSELLFLSLSAFAWYRCPKSHQCMQPHETREDVRTPCGVFSPVTSSTSTSAHSADRPI